MMHHTPSVDYPGIFNKKKTPEYPAFHSNNYSDLGITPDCVGAIDSYK